MSHAAKPHKLKLPASLVTRRDLARTISEFEAYDSAITEADIQSKAGQTATNQPAMSDLVRALVDENELQLDGFEQRSQVIKQLRRLRDHAPVFHLRFAAGLNVDEQQQLSNWFRQSVDSQALLDIGIQPAVIGGVYIRSKNRVYDLSWRQKFVNSRKVISSKLQELAVQ